MKNTVSLAQPRSRHHETLSPRQERVMRCRARRFQHSQEGVCGNKLGPEQNKDQEIKMAFANMQKMTAMLMEQFTQAMTSIVDRLVSALTDKLSTEQTGGSEKPQEEAPIEGAPEEPTTETAEIPTTETCPTEEIAPTTAPECIGTTPTSAEETPPFDASLFDTDIRELLNNGGKNGKVNEERFQFAIAAHLIKSKDELAYESFVTAFRTANKKGANGVEDATKNALKDLVANGQLTKKEAREINGVSFAAAQLDDNDKALYDGRGGKNDPTVARMKIDQAIAKATSVLEQYYAGNLSIAPRKLNAPSTPASSNSDAAQGVNSSGNGEFLWKPQSESNGKLVVLLPSGLRGDIDSVGIYSNIPANKGSLIEEGNFSGDDHNGNRPHYRFSQAGGGYPDGAYLVAKLSDGTEQAYQINETSERLNK